MNSKLSGKEQGIVKAVLDRFNQDRLPALLKIQSRVDQGEVLTDIDIRLLEECIQEAKSGAHFAETHPEFKSLIAKVSGLYQYITARALENQNG